MTGIVREEALSKVVKIVEDVCDWTQFMVIEENINLFKELNLNTSDLHEVLLEMEVRFNTHIPDKAVSRIETVGDLVNTVTEQTN